MKKKHLAFLVIAVMILFSIVKWTVGHYNLNIDYKVGQAIDSLNGVSVFYNGGVDNVSGRNTTNDGYNLGLKFQCVEFVKRYYYEQLNHKMPDSYGHASDFFDNEIKDGALNVKRDLIQYTNPSETKPEVDDLLIFRGTIFNRYGHVAIISKVADNEIEILQQNPGPFGKSRETIALEYLNSRWEIDNKKVLGWLRLGNNDVQ